MNQINSLCPFCTLPTERIIESNEHGFAIRDNFPVTRGHSLIIPKRHIASWFDASKDEQLGLLQLLGRSKAILKNEFDPDGFNIGINDGVAAGQTVLHLHLQLIPRYSGDLEDPRGGVRWIFPEKAKYW